MNIENLDYMIIIASFMRVEQEFSHCELEGPVLKVCT